MFKKITTFLIVVMLTVNSYAQPTPEFVEHMRKANSALENGNNILACASGKEALRTGSGIPQELFNSLTEMVNKVCQLAKHQEAGENKRQRDFAEYSKMCSGIPRIDLASIEAFSTFLGVPPDSIKLNRVTATTEVGLFGGNILSCNGVFYTPKGAKNCSLEFVGNTAKIENCK
jgi:hypothetical protein